jgi:hypothetical protein
MAGLLHHRWLETQEKGIAQPAGVLMDHCSVHLLGLFDCSLVVSELEVMQIESSPASPVFVAKKYAD